MAIQEPAPAPPRGRASKPRVSVPRGAVTALRPTPVTDALVAPWWRPRHRRIAALVPRFAFAVDAVALLLPAVARADGRLPLVAFALLCLVLLRAGGDYRLQLKLSVLDELPRLARAVVVAGLGVGAAVDLWSLHPGVGSFAVMAGAAAVLLLLFRTAFYLSVSALRRSGRVMQRALIVGSGHVASQVVQTLRSDPRYGLQVVGYADGAASLDSIQVAPRLGDASSLDLLARQHAIGTIIVAFGWDRDSELATMIRRRGLSGPSIYVVPRLFDVYAGSGHSLHVGAVPLVRVRPGTELSLARVVKRGLDVAVSLTALALLSPLLLTAALAVMLEGGRDVLFRQVRVGRDGQLFELIKFRSMKPADPNESQTQWNIGADPRVGRVGRVLRRTSVDELPQLWNVLRGEMSLVGPRPERPHFVDSFSEEFSNYEYRHRVRVGLTGLAQVNGLRGDTSISDRARYDNYYIDNWSLWLDIKIMIATLTEVVGARGR